MRTDAFPLLLDWAAAVALPPAFIFFAAAIVTALLRGERRRAQQVVLLLTPLIGLLNLITLEAGSGWVWKVLDFEFVQLRVDRLSMLFGFLFHVGAFIGILYSLRVRDTAQHAAALVYVGSALGAVFAGDLITLFFYWEGMAISSAFLVWARRTPESNGAGFRYLALHLLSGLLLLAGALIHYQATGRIAFEFVGVEGIAGWLILAAFGIKCGFPLVHNWITDAYPQSTPTGTVFLSMFTTKVAVYALARGFPGTELLIVIGTVMAVFPIFYAVIENDLRRVLGYSMINQIGFMVVGVGIGSELALNGAVAHAFNEVLFKGLLFMSMGAVLLRVRHVRGSDLGGLYRSMPLTAVFCVIGAASISAFPLFSGFVSKSMIMAAMIEEGHVWMWLALLFASAGVFHHAGIKIPYFAFFGHDARIRATEAPRNMLLAMAIAAGLCVFVGSYPAALYHLLPWEVDYLPYTYPHVLAQMQLLLFSALAFAWLKLTGIYPPELRSVNLDADWLYRRFGMRFAEAIEQTTARISGAVGASLRAALRPLAHRLLGPRSLLVRPLGTGNAALWSSVLLTGYLLLYFVANS
ncbi:MAG TPA: Na(+)/H(+) antiporter subunit D [Gammaproteobacteria bacterium]|nr:Na(+)/H(+) antiporter subunit D [Gammaproteobacteria bacterium]